MEDYIDNNWQKGIMAPVTYTDGKIWKFMLWDYNSQIFPLKSIGTIKNPSFPVSALRYAIDCDNNFWIGDNNTGEMFMKSPQYALDLIFSYDILKWSSVCELLGDEIVQYIIDNSHFNQCEN